MRDHLPDGIAGAFASNFNLTSRERDDLVRHGVRTEAIDQGAPIRAGLVHHLAGGRFEFEQHARLSLEVKAKRAFLILCQDEFGDAIDIAAWMPLTGDVSLWLERAWAIGQDRVLAPRLDEDLPVWRDPLAWLQADRRGIVILNPRAAAPILDDCGPLSVTEEKFGTELRQALTRKGPRILVPAANHQRRAA